VVAADRSHARSFGFDGVSVARSQRLNANPFGGTTNPATNTYRSPIAAPYIL